MADVADMANDLAQEHLERSLAAQVRHRRVGNSFCSCGEEISELRKSMGAVRCIDCQDEYERS